MTGGRRGCRETGMAPVPAPTETSTAFVVVGCDGVYNIYWVQTFERELEHQHQQRWRPMRKKNMLKTKVVAVVIDIDLNGR